MSLLKKDSLLTHVLLAVGASVLLVVLLIYGLDIYTRHGGYGQGTQPAW